MNYLEELVTDYESYLESLEHCEDGDYTTYIWNYPEAAIAEYGEKMYKIVTNHKLSKVYERLVELEQDFV